MRFLAGRPMLTCIGGAKNGPENEPKMDPKMDPPEGRFLAKTLCFHCVFANPGSPKGVHFGVTFGTFSGPPESD